ncbi:uncharacterized protein LOC127255490 [Andrographis paniculata]|uniref:uncharacterized protein LOC127255490 n=1 Tax=Andrographis paniculata TaxID=175694 RepID=UPI0021E738F7|nr:uncharacterized protein LOC127255490 [Andrographis paniculata]
MRRRATRKLAAEAAFLASRRPETPAEAAAAAAAAAESPTLSPAESPASQFALNFSGLRDIAEALKRSNKNSSAGTSGIKRMQPTGLSPSLKSVNTISDLKEMVSTNVDSLKRRLERSHSEILKDIEASHCRLQKRFKIQTQACQQVMDEAEKEYKNMSEQINEGRKAMKASFAEFIADAQHNASRRKSYSFIRKYADHNLTMLCKH